LPRQEATDGGPFVKRAFIKHLLITSVKPDGTAVATAVRAARDGDRVYFRLSSGSATARRLRRCDWVQVAPSSVLGFVSYGPPAGATARPLDGAAASRAAACLDRDPAWRRAAWALLNRVTGWRTEYYEVRPDPVPAG
jgi:PPOX class probable F420-dependent enzyme